MIREEESQNHTTNQETESKPPAIQTGGETQKIQGQRSPNNGLQKPTQFKSLRSPSHEGKNKTAQPPASIGTTPTRPLSKSLIQNGLNKAQANHNSQAQTPHAHAPADHPKLPPLSPMADRNLQGQNIGSARVLKHAFTEQVSDSNSAFEGGNLSNSARKSRKSLIVLNQAQKDNVKVVIRIRPLNEREISQGSAMKQCVTCTDAEKIVLDRALDQKQFTFDYVANPDTRQIEIFEKIAMPIADSCLQGYNGSIFAYGQTGSGKTYTIQGPTISIKNEDQIISAQNSNEETYELRGIMQRSFEYIFGCMEKQKREAEQNGVEMQFLIKASYLEIYNEQIVDLLDPQSHALHIREDITKGVYVEALQEETVSGVKDMIALITRGARNRHVSSTAMNKESSRSHSVLTTQIESKTMNASGVWQMKSSRFHIIDLAGSERSKATNAVGERLKEAGMINKSLTALGIVINSLVDISEGKNRHVHYRDSKLTFLLRDSLGGNSKTVIIANVTPAHQNVGESLSTLMFAQRAKLIKNKAVINEESSSTIHHLKAELRRVKKELAESTGACKQLQDALTNLQLRPEHQRSRDEAEEQLCRLCKANAVADGEDFSLRHDDSLLSVEASPRDMNESFLVQSNSKPAAFKLYKQRLLELNKMTERVDKVEKLLCANLESLDIQSKQSEQQIESLTEANKNKQISIEAFMKNGQRDRMVLKFREERIQELENKLAKIKEERAAGSTNSDCSGNCEECKSLRVQLANAKQEANEWKATHERNPPAAKLFAEKAELEKKLKSAFEEMKATPESLTARIRGLNDLTNDLNSYLKQYCMHSQNDLKNELERTKTDLNGKVDALTSELSLKETVHQDKLKTLSEQHESELNELKEKIETMKVNFQEQKTRIEQNAQDQVDLIKKDLEQRKGQTLSVEEEMQKFKVDAFEKQSQLQRGMSLLETSLKEKEDQNDQLETLIKKSKEEIAKLQEKVQATEQHGKDEVEKLRDELENERNFMSNTLLECREKQNKEIQDLEKEIMTRKEENRMLEQDRSDFENKWEVLRQENEGLQNQVIEKQELIDETHRNLAESKTKLTAAIAEREQQHENTLQIERDLQEQIKAQNQQIQDLNSRQEEDKQLFEKLEAQLQESTRLKEVESSRAEDLSTKLQSELQSNEKLLQESQASQTKITSQQETIDALTESTKQLELKVEQAQTVAQEKASLEQQKKDCDEKIALLTDEANVLQISLQKESEKAAAFKQEIELNKEQLLAMEETTVSLTRENQEKDTKISILQNAVSEKDAALVKKTQTLDHNENELRNELQVSNSKIESLNVKIKLMTAEIQSKKQENEQLTSKSQMMVNGLERSLQIEYQKEKEYIAKQATFEAQIAELKMAHSVEKAKITESAQQQAIQEKQRQKEQFEISLKQNQEALAQETTERLREKEDELELKQGEINDLVYRIRRESQQRQTAVKCLLQAQAQVRELRSEHAILAESVVRESSWAKIGPSQPLVMDIVSKIQDLGSIVGVVNQVQTELQESQQDCQELKEQLVEYKGLTQQLQEEKQALNARLNEHKSEIEVDMQSNQQLISSLNLQLQVTQTELAESHQMLAQQKHLLDDSLQRLNQQHIEKYQLQQQEFQDKMRGLQAELDQSRKARAELEKDLAKFKTKTSEQNNMLLNSKETITNMVTKENQLMSDLKKKITELGEQQEHYKNRVMQSKQEKEAISQKYDTLKKENENLRQLIKIKDGQIEDSAGYEQGHRGERDRYSAENKKLKEQLQKREGEIKEVVLTLKAFSDEKKRLEKELEQVKSYELQIGHSNQAQKIQHHLKIKEENNKLKEDNYKLQEELRRKCEALAQTNPGGSMMETTSMFSNVTNRGGTPSEKQPDPEKLKKELHSLQESSSRLTDHLLKLPGVSGFVAANETLSTHFKKPAAGTPSSTSATYYANQKLQGCMEVITQISRQLQSRIQECNQMSQEFKHMEQTIHNLQRDKNTLIQTLESAGLSPASQHQRGIPPIPSTKQRQFSSGNGRSKEQQDSHLVARGNYAVGGGTPTGSAAITMQNIQHQAANQKSSQGQQQQLSSGLTQQPGSTTNKSINQYRRQNSNSSAVSGQQQQFNAQQQLKDKQMHLLLQQQQNRL